jgi:hypothetical protein
MSVDNVAPDKRAEQIATIVAKYVEQDLKPYLDLIVKGMRRALKLVNKAIDPKDETSDDIYRAVVVLNHAYLEDFLRTLALAFLPMSDEEALDDVPLSGLGRGGRAEKFLLGKLAQHRGKSIDDLIRESVSEHLERSTFNNVTEIMSFLESVGLQVPQENEYLNSILSIVEPQSVLSQLEAMMQRRHHIVHRADKARNGDGLEPIDPRDVVKWLTATIYFMGNVAHTSFLKQHPSEELAKELREVAGQFDANAETAEPGAERKPHK